MKRTLIMSWISPTFDDAGPSTQPPKKKSKSNKSTEAHVEVTSSNDFPSVSCNWLEQYKPKTVGELAIHVKKVNELEAWLKQPTSLITRTKFLLITGPPGCGKTTMLHIVCKSCGYKIQEWITPLDRPDDEFESLTRFEYNKSAAKLFEEYLFKSSRYSSCLGINPTKKLILVKDFPNVMFRNPSTFHEILENLTDKCMTPIVFVSSDDSLCKKLFPNTLKTQCNVQTLVLNPITDQRMFKVLKQLIVQEVKRDRNISMMPDDALSDICSASQGDFRSAISKLFFLSISSGSLYVPKVPMTPTHRLKPASQVSGSSPKIKDKKLDFFHGLGRVLYPKRIESNEGLKFVHSAEAIVENFESEPSGFLSQLHENYPSRIGDIDDLSKAAGRLATSDILRSRWQDREIFNHYSLAVAVRGLMVSNRTPQKAKFEAFRKSHTSRMEVDNKAIELEGKALFSDLNILGYECLIDILPHARLLLPNLNQGHMEYIRKTSVFK